MSIITIVKRWHEGAMQIKRTKDIVYIQAFQPSLRSLGRLENKIHIAIFDQRQELPMPDA